MKLAYATVRGSFDTHIVSVNDDEGTVTKLDTDQIQSVAHLSDIIYSKDPMGLVNFLITDSAPRFPIDDVDFLKPNTHEEIRAAGVPYKRSQVARMEESEAGADHYDRVYTADRPELFLKATSQRVSGPGEPVRVRYDSKWSVPEPELALFISPAGQVCGFTVGNDMSARDIEGENPLYLPQAKFYFQSCSLGPCVLLAQAAPPREEFVIEMTITRRGEVVYNDSTNAGEMVRDFDDLASWLMRENHFFDGAVLLTGTGLVPPDEFTLAAGDQVSISIAGIGTLTNPVVQESLHG